jgi:hypothetical protein
LLFNQVGTRPGRLAYRPVWDAERFSDRPHLCGPVADARNQSLATADLDGDRQLELLLSGPHHDPDLVLLANGVEPNAGQLPDSARRRRRVLLGPGVGVRTLPRPATVGADGLPVWLVTINGHPVYVSCCLPPDSAGGAQRHALSAADSAGRSLWTLPMAPMAMLWAVADLDADGSDDLLFGTYGEEHGLRVDGTTDSETAYCVAVSADGRRLWQTAFGGASFVGCRAAVGDLDADGSLEVAAAVYTWRHGFGGLYVLDAASGRIRARAGGPESLPASHVSVGLADFDGDGRPELAATTAGPRSWLALWRFIDDSLLLAARAQLGSVPSGLYYGLLHAICDLDGDGRLELVTSGARCIPVCTDPVFYPVKVDSPCITVLDRDLRPASVIHLPEVCRSLVLAELCRGGNVDIVVRTDRLTLLSAD